MPPDPRLVPTAIKAPHGARVMTIRWADGHDSVLPHRILRGFCPCANCQGHGGGIKFVAGGDEEIRELERVGLYAISLTWGDGHSAGIYSFRLLRGLCQCPACLPTSEFIAPEDNS